MKIQKADRSWSVGGALLPAFFLACVGLALAPAGAAQAQPPPDASAAGAVPPAPAAGGRKRRQPPPPVIPLNETSSALKQYNQRNYEAAVTQAKAALTKNDKYTPAMLVMAKSYYKLRKYEWVRHLWKMMQANGATPAEQADMYHLLAWMEIEKNNVPGSIEMLKKATEARPENPIFWNNLGAQYLEAKNYKEAVPTFGKAVELNPTFVKAYVNLGSAHRGLKEYDKAKASYDKALQLFPTYADAIFHLGILFLDAEKMPNLDTIAKLNTAIGHFLRYRQMMSSAGQLKGDDPVNSYLNEAQDKIIKEQKRIERQKQQEERERKRQQQKGAAPAQPGAPAAPGPQGAQPPAGQPPAGQPPGGLPPGGQPPPPAPAQPPQPQ
jgi:tetratricopeptide (TPR) repeat protein